MSKDLRAGLLSSYAGGFLLFALPSHFSTGEGVLTLLAVWQLGGPAILATVTYLVLRHWVLGGQMHTVHCRGVHLQPYFRLSKLKSLAAILAVQ